MRQCPYGLHYSVQGADTHTHVWVSHFLLCCSTAARDHPPGPKGQCCLYAVPV